jgi:hypothetical protein
VIIGTQNRVALSDLTRINAMEVSVPVPMPLDFSITVKSRHDPPPSSSPATGLVLPASVAPSSAGLLKLLKESGAPRSGGATVAGESSSAFRVVTPKGKFEGRPKQFKLSLTLILLTWSIW